MGKTFILSAIIAGSISAPLLCNVDGMASVSTEVYPEQILVALTSDHYNPNTLSDKPRTLKPGKYLFWTSYAQSGMSCREEATLEGDKTYNVKLELNEGICAIQVNEIN